jgi:glycogen(starch) synthase
METLKIAFFCWESLYAERVGGLASAATNLAETLAKQHEVHFFSRGGGRDAEINGVQYHYCRPGGENILQHCAEMSHQMVEQFRKYDSPKFDILHFHDWHVVEALHTLQERETILTYHSTEYGRCGNNFADNWLFREISGKEWYGAYIANHVTTVSSTLRDEAMQLYRVPDWKIDVVPNGIVPHQYRADVDPEEVKKQYGVEAASPLILFVGRLAWQKGPDILVDAVPKLLKKHQDGRILFVGDGQMRTDLEKRARKLPVTFLGHLPDTEYIPLLNASDIVAIPSRNEPFGLVLLEAWSAGRCVVASDVGGLGENIRHGTDGVKVVPQPRAVAKGLSSVADSPEKMARLGREGRKKVEETFRWSRVADRMVDVYKKTGVKGA